MTHSDTMALAYVVATVDVDVDYDEEKAILIERLVRRGLL
jgi:hypothetical protein